MSASAAEFVPFASTPTAGAENGQTTAANRKLTRTPLGELTDSSANVVAGNGKDLKGKKQQKSAKPDVASAPQQLGQQQAQSNALPLPLPAGNVTKLATASKLGLVPSFVEEVQKEEEAPQKEEAQKEEPAAPNAALKEPAAAGTSVEDEEKESRTSSKSDTDGEEAPAVSTAVCGEGLPSVGSALHASGECRSCNFFTKGRCQNGKDCSFCHFTHEKRKPSRAQKRERQLVQQMQQQGSEFGGLLIDTEFDEEMANLSCLGSPMEASFLGLPPLLASGYPSAAMCGSPSLNAAALGLNLGNNSVGAEGPPGLSSPLGLPMTPCMTDFQQWQANEEANMALISALTADASAQQACGVSCTSPSVGGPLLSTPAPFNIFSTAPPSMVNPMATPTMTPNADAAAESAAAGGVENTTPISGTPRLSGDALEPRYVEMSTQTACVRCDIAADEKEVGTTKGGHTTGVSKMDMLRIRSQMTEASSEAGSTAGARRATWRTAVKRGALAQDE
jgi:hypothetical protein